MQEYLNDWTKYKLTLPTDRGDLVVKWADVETLAKWSNIQAGLYLKAESSSLQAFFENFPNWYKYFWEQRHGQGLFNLPEGSRIMDIGCGVAVIDLLLYSYIPNSKFYLLDKEGFEFRPGIFYDEKYPVYNSWSPVVDAIKTSGFDPERFTIQGPDIPFPEDLDCITSYLSWCWHYPKEIYWDRAFNSLKKGGKLILDVRVLADRDVMGEIAEAMKCEPQAWGFDKKLPKHVDNMPTPEGSLYSGYRAMWTKNV